MRIPDHALKVYEGKIFQVYEWEQIMFDGSVEIFERVSALPIVKLLCITPDGKILINTEEQPWKDVFLSLPGGRLEIGETLIEWAKRELLEETGMEALEFIPLDQHNVGYRLDLEIHIFIARWCVKTSTVRLDPGEKISSHLVSIDECLNNGIAGLLHPRSFQFLLLREFYKDPTLTQFKNTILGNNSHLVA